MAGSADSPPSGYLWGMRWTFTECPTDTEQKTQRLYKAVRTTLLPFALRSTPCCCPSTPLHCPCTALRWAGAVLRSSCAGPALTHVHISTKRRRQCAAQGRSCTHVGALRLDQHTTDNAPYSDYAQRNGAAAPRRGAGQRLGAAPRGPLAGAALEGRTRKREGEKGPPGSTHNATNSKSLEGAKDERCAYRM